VIASASLLVAGLVGLIWTGGESFDPSRFAHFTAPVPDAPGFWLGTAGVPDALLHLGLLLLLLLPASRLAVAAVLFFRRRDPLFAGVSLLVLALVVTSTMLAKVE
jgi:hypothetical protein